MIRGEKSDDTSTPRRDDKRGALGKRIGVEEVEVVEEDDKDGDVDEDEDKDD